MTASLYQSGSLMKAAGRGLFGRLAMESPAVGADAPDAERQPPGFDAHPLALAVPGPALAGHQVLTVQGGFVRQAELPQRNLELALLGMERVQADGHQHEFGQVLGVLAEVEDVVVPHVVGLEAEVRLRWEE